MKVKSIVHKDCVASFSIVAEGLLVWLKELHSEDPLSMLVGQSDHTFKLEWTGYSFGSFGVVLHRRVKGAWEGQAKEEIGCVKIFVILAIDSAKTEK